MPAWSSQPVWFSRFDVRCFIWEVCPSSVFSPVFPAPTVSDGFWLLSYIKHSCGLITDEKYVSVKGKSCFDIITHHTHTHWAETRQLTYDECKDVQRCFGSFIIPWRVFDDLNTGLAASWLLLYSHLQTSLLIKAIMISVCLPQAPICWSLRSY